MGPSQVVPPPHGVHPPWHPAVAGAARAMPLATSPLIVSATSAFILHPFSAVPGLQPVPSPLSPGYAAVTGWESGFPYGFRVESQCVLGAIVGRMTGDLRKQLSFVPCRTPNRYRSWLVIRSGSCAARTVLAAVGGC